MHMLARNFTKTLEKELQLNGNLELCGKTLAYNKIYMGRLHGQSGDEWVTVEEYIDEKFTKYLNSTGIPCGANSEIRQKCESLAHFSYERSHENIMVVDMQLDSDHILFDPEIASKELFDGEEVLRRLLFKNSLGLKLMDHKSLSQTDQHHHDAVSGKQA